MEHWHWYVWTRVLFVTVAGFHWGYDLGSINGVKDMAGYRQTLNLSFMPSAEGSGNASESCDSDDSVETTAILGLIVSLLSVGCLAGALMGGFLSDLVGRKPVVILGASLVSLGALLHTAALNLWMALLSRIIGGIGLGILFQVVPVYVAEISPEKLRGRMQTFFTTFQAVGVLLGSILNVFVKDLLFGWRISLSIQFVVSTILALGGVVLLPRSPRWLVKKHRNERALNILTKIYADECSAKAQLKEIQSAVSSKREPFVETLKYILQWKILQRLVIGYLLLFLGRLGGLSYIAYFSVSIFCGIGLPGFAASVGLGAMGILSIMLSLAVIDRLGRKPVFLVTLSAVMFTLVTSGVLILALDLESPGAGYTTSQLVAGYAVMILTYLFLASGALGLASVPWIVVSEMFPLRGRGFMVSIANTGYWLGVIITNQASPILTSSPIGISGTLFLFAGGAFSLFLVVLLLLPETKDQTLEKIEEIFSKLWLERINIAYYLRCSCLLECVPCRKKEGSVIKSYHHTPADTQTPSDTPSCAEGDYLVDEDEKAVVDKRFILLETEL